MERFLVLQKKRCKPKTKYFCVCIQEWFCVFFWKKNQTNNKTNKQQRNALKKRSHLKIRGCKDSYSLMTAGFNLETSEN